MKEDQVEDFSYLLYNPKNAQVGRGMVECDINYNTCMTVARDLGEDAFSI